jgi:hypothetical protein
MPGCWLRCEVAQGKRRNMQGTAALCKSSMSGMCRVSVSVHKLTPHHASTQGAHHRGVQPAHQCFDQVRDSCLGQASSHQGVKCQPGALVDQVTWQQPYELQAMQHTPIVGQVSVDAAQHARHLLTGTVPCIIHQGVCTTAPVWWSASAGPVYCRV